MIVDFGDLKGIRGYNRTKFHTRARIKRANSTNLPIQKNLEPYSLLGLRVEPRLWPLVQKLLFRDNDVRGKIRQLDTTFS